MAEDKTARQISRSLRDGLRISQVSLAWTIAAGSCAVVVGVIGNSLTLITFGLIAFLDGIGSGSLIVHFRHARRHETVSERHERLALLVVTAGMATIGVATIVGSAYRLSTRATSDPLPSGIALVAVSVPVLATLAARKRQIAQRIPSHALRADGWLSAMGAVLALVALAGTGLDAAFGWWWTDALAAIAIALGAVALSVVLVRGPDAG